VSDFVARVEAGDPLSIGIAMVAALVIFACGLGGLAWVFAALDRHRERRQIQAFQRWLDLNKPDPTAKSAERHRRSLEGERP
jgi:hypothetical protein